MLLGPNGRYWGITWLARARNWKPPLILGAGNNRITTTGNGRRPYGVWRVPRKDREITRDGCWFLARYLRWTAGSERLAKLRRSEGIECPQGFPYWPKALTIPANTEVRLLLDNDYLTTGYFSLAFSKGKEAEIHIGYSEALYKQEEESTTKSYALRQGTSGRVDG